MEYFILFSPSGSAVLTYFGKWDFVESDIDYEMARRLYIAPGDYDKKDMHRALLATCQ